MTFPPPLRVAIPLLLLIFGIIVGLVSLSHERRTDEQGIEERLKERAEFLGTTLAAMCAHFAESGMTASAQREIALSAMNPDLRLAMVFGGDDRVQQTTRFEMENRSIADTPAAPHQALINRARQRMSGELQLSADRNSMIGAYPFLLNAQGTSQLRSEAIGVVFLDFDLAEAKGFARANAAARLQISGAVLIGLVAIFSVILHRLMTNRVKRLINTSEKLGTGQLGVRAGIHGGDELAQLSDALDKMAAKLQRRESELFASDQQFRQFADSVGEIFWLLDVNAQKPLYVNAGFERVFGVPGSEFLASISAWHDAIHPEDRPNALAAFAREHEGGHDIEYRIVRPDGGIRWLRDRSFTVADAQGNVTRMAGVADDITAQKLTAAEKEGFDRKMQEMQRLESLGVLAGGIAHDFNNLLTGMLGNASLARVVLPETHEIQKYLSEIEGTAVRAADLCKQMLAYSGKGRFQVETIDLGAILRESSQLLQLTVAKDAKLQIDLAPELPAITADTTQLRQVIVNLVTNASEALGGKGGSITLSTGRVRLDTADIESTALIGEVTPGDFVSLEVSDTGSGMTPDTVGRIFEPFFTTKFPGRGLGLSAVLGIVRGHKGAMKVESEIGKGTTFTVLFPIPDEVPPPRPSKVRKALALGGTGTILLVDDEDTVRLVVSRMLDAMGFKVVVAKDGLEGVEAFRATNGEFNAVLMDLTMPRMNGEEAFRQMRTISPEVRVILMSGFNEQEAIHNFTGKGLAGFLQKPFKPDALRAKMREILDLGEDANAAQRPKE